MAWRYPNTVAVAPQTAAINGTTKLTANPVIGSSVNVACDFQKLTPGRAFEDFGVQLQNPARIYIQSSDLSKFPQGARVTFESILYDVVHSMKRSVGRSTVDYGLVVLERINF
jgi:hypothetical protein